eukprot:879510-Rhodomonas_salina.1
MEVHQEGLRQHVNRRLFGTAPIRHVSYYHTAYHGEAPGPELDKRRKREEAPEIRAEEADTLADVGHGGAVGPARADVEGGHAVDDHERERRKTRIEDLHAAETRPETPVQARAPFGPRGHAVDVVGHGGGNGEDGEEGGEEARVEGGGGSLVLTLFALALAPLLLLH